MLAFSIAGFRLALSDAAAAGRAALQSAGIWRAVTPDLSFNTSVSFVTNTNWQSYAGETTMSYLVQMLGLTVHNFVSAATGIALALALIRGFARRSAKTLGNFWVDLTRCTLYVLLPLVHRRWRCSWCGRACRRIWAPIPAPSAWKAPSRLIAQGPVASQEAIKMLGTNGGGFFNANSAHPFENPTGLTNFVEMWSHSGDQRGADLHLRPHGQGHPPGLGDLRRDGPAVPGRARHHLLGGRPGQCRRRRRPCRAGRQHGRQGSALRRRQLRPVRHRHHRCLLRQRQRHA